MPKFLVLGHGSPPKDDPKAAMQRWTDWFVAQGDAIVDTGAPFMARAALGDVPAATRANGFMIVAAADLDAAAALVGTSPAAAEGQALEVFELMDMPY